ncbi:MAG: hypothetical protein ACKVU1_03390 [bacterium]
MTRFVMIAAVLMATFAVLSFSSEPASAAGSGGSQFASSSGGAASSSSSSAAVVSRGPWPRPPFPTKLAREEDPNPGELTIRVPIVVWLGMIF